jgi:T5orf172 domain
MLIDNRPYRIYVIEEDAEKNTDMGYTSDWRKIGIAVLSGEDKTMDDFNLRLRALHQGNPRILRVAASWEAKFKKEAAELEQKIHERLKGEGICSRVNFTGETGHGEWFKVDLLRAITTINEIIAAHEREIVVFGTLFTFDNIDF